MKSLHDFKTKNSCYYNSLHATLTEEVYYEGDLFINRGKYIDNIFEKMSIYNYRLRHGSFINEAYANVEFSINEQFAARDLLINIANNYAYSLVEEFCNENDVIIEEGLSDFFKGVKGGVDKLLQNSAAFIKTTTQKGKEKFDEVLNKLKQVKQFIIDIKNKAITTAKQLVDKITQMMTSLGCSLVNLIKKLGGNAEQSYQEFEGMVTDAFKDEKKQKENIYENFGKEFALILEAKDNIMPNEYDDAANAKPGSKFVGGIKMLGGAILKMILQMMAYYAVTIVLPAVIGLIAGPLAAAIAACIAKIVWSSATIWKQVQDMRKTVKSEEYKNSPKWMKGLRWALFILSIAGSAFTLAKGLGDAFKIGKAIAEGAAGTVLPDEAVQKCMKILNEFWKTLTGGNAPGYEALLKAQNQTWTEVVEATSAEKEASNKGKESFDTHKNNEFKASETNTFKHTEDIAGKDFADNMKNLADKNIGKSMEMLNQAEQVVSNTPGVTVFGVDGATLGKIGRAEYINQIASKIGIDPSNIDISQVTNTALQKSSEGMAGTIFQVVIKGDATSQMADKVSTAVNQVAQGAGTQGWFHMFSKVADFSETTTKLIQHPMDLIKTSFSAFGGLFPIAIKNFKKGGFKIRLASKESNYNILYHIESESDIKEMSFNDAVKNYANLNEPVFKNMATIIKNNKAALEKYKEEKKQSKSLSKEEKKRLQAIDKQLAKMDDASDDYKLLVLFGKKIVTKTTGKANEAKDNTDKNDEKIPVMFINPMIMGCGDLAPQSTSKGPRKQIWYFKGLFARVEIIPVDGGMTVNEVIKLFTNIAKESLKACYNMNPDVPCYKDGKNFVENDKSIYKGKRRSDFGDFTNSELTDILGGDNDITKYLAGKYAAGSQAKNDDKENKEHYEKVKARYIKEIETNDEIKEFIKKSKTLKGKLLTTKDGKDEVNTDELEKLSDKLVRIENNYLNAPKKKGFFQKIKDFFTGGSDKDEYDPEEVKTLAYKLASARKSRKTNEGLYDEQDIIFEANLEILNNEFVDFWHNENSINESIDEDNEVKFEFYEISL